MTDTTQDDELVERVARIIDPTSFRYHESMFSYCLAQGDDDSTAKRYADETHGASMETAREIARAAIAAMPIAALRAENEALRACLTECADDLESEVRDRWGYDERLSHKLERDLVPVVAARALLGSKT